MYEKSFVKYADDIALTDFSSGRHTTYMDIAVHVERMHILLNDCGLKKGSKVALIGQNHPQWVITYIGVITYGAIIVPILPDFSGKDIENIINESDAELLFTECKISKKINFDNLKKLKGVVDYIQNKMLFDGMNGDFKTLFKNNETSFWTKYPEGLKINNIHYADLDKDDVIIISYTSGTSGFSKGVMLTVENITSNIEIALKYKFHFYKSRVLGLLPLAHAYGCAFDMLTPLTTGSHITLLGQTPTPKVLISALQQVKPHLLCTVPLVMEKLVKKFVFPQIEKPIAKFLISLPVLKRIIYKRICNKLLKTFGGCVMELNMGGAALNPEVENFLLKIGFPFTVGYGMTECGPLICYEYHTTYKQGSCGRILDGMQIKLDSNLSNNSLRTNNAGEICVKGRNVMKGYYKNQIETDKVIDEEGWLHTGDVGTIDKDGYVTICGRCKNMILGNNGQNIYPESIEAKCNELQGVADSLVVDIEGKIVALVYPEQELMNDIEELRKLMANNLKILNTQVAPYEKVAAIRILAEDFVRTPKRSIKRYLYPTNAKYID